MQVFVGEGLHFFLYHPGEVLFLRLGHLLTAQLFEEEFFLPGRKDPGDRYFQVQLLRGFRCLLYRFCRGFRALQKILLNILRQDADVPYEQFGAGIEPVPVIGYQSGRKNREKLFSPLELGPNALL